MKGSCQRPGNGQLTSRVLAKGQDEANISTKRSEACEASRIPSQDVNSSRPGHFEGPSPARTGETVGLNGRPLAVRGQRAFQLLLRSRRQARNGPVTVHFVPADDGVDER